MLKYLWILMVASCDIGTIVYGKDYKLVDVDKLDLEYSQLDENNRDPYYPEGTGNWKERAALKWDLNLFNTVFWRNNVHTETLRSNGQVKTVGWEYEVAIPFPILSQFELFKYHHSRHVMEAEPENRFPGSDFPVDDSIGIRIKFINKEKK